MLRRQAAVAMLLFALLLPGFAIGQQQQPTPPKDPNDPIEKIKDEGLNHSQIMETLSYLTDVIGPRLTASPSMKRANEWTRDKLTSWGLQNAHLEAWGPFGRGWTLKSFYAQVIDPQDIPLIAFPKAWSPGTNGPVTGDVVYLDAKNDAELDQFKGKLKGAIVLTAPPRELKANFTPLGGRLDDKRLQTLADAPDPATVPRRQGGGRGANPDARTAQLFAIKKLQFCLDEGAAVLADTSRTGDGGTIVVQSATVPQPPTDNPFDRSRIQPWDKSGPKLTPQIVVSAEQYDRMIRMIKLGEMLKMTVDIKVQFHDQDLMGYNTVAEIPGTDLKDEIVMLGGHMDSWHAGTGATDNGAGVAVAMEAVRILKAAGLKPRRTIRIALWSGEEEGLFGSRAYVAQHFGARTDANANSLAGVVGGAPPGPVATKPEYDKLSAYYNLDNGTGKIRGIYLQGNLALRPLFQKWLIPFADMGASTLTNSNTGSTDHVSFDTIGLPGFQFIQDEIEYETRTHHTNQDVFDRIQADDIKEAAVIMAAFVYNTAMMDQKIQRKPLPVPSPSPVAAAVK